MIFKWWTVAGVFIKWKTFVEKIEHFPIIEKSTYESSMQSKCLATFTESASQTSASLSEFSVYRKIYAYARFYGGVYLTTKIERYLWRIPFMSSEITMEFWHYTAEFDFPASNEKSHPKIKLNVSQNWNANICYSNSVQWSYIQYTELKDL